MKNNYSNYFVDAFDTLQDAIIDNDDVKIKYHKWNGEKSTRTITPERFTFVKRFKSRYDRLCIKAFCHLRKEDRIFAVYRIDEASIV
jgi:predicted DNA-binding transcriptional regulator YafY|tara:strand:+ start:753 stop:1013 length:261 start_codon:yes stop_codon:yes gene_type:complete